MFGGPAFLIGGNMAISASGQGEIMVLVDPGESDVLVAGTAARLVEMRGPEMPGWLLVGAEDLGTDDQLLKWVELGTTYALAAGEAVSRGSSRSGVRLRDTSGQANSPACQGLSRPPGMSAVGS
jgi:hypothetical protein